MNILIIHQNFPGQFKLLAQALAGNPDIKLVALGDASRYPSDLKNPYSFPLITYSSRNSEPSKAHHYLAGVEQSIRRGQDVLRACLQIKAKGFVPDLIIGHPAWGEMYFIKDAFPDAKLISYFEFFYQPSGTDFGFDPEFQNSIDDIYKLRIRNTTQLHALSVSDAGVSPTAWQRSTYTKRDQGLVHVIHEGLDLERLRPDPRASFRLADGRTLDRTSPVITFVSRQLEPYRGFHRFMRALPKLQKLLPKAHFVIVGSDGVSYGSPPPKLYKNYREMMLNEVGSDLDINRTHFTGRIDYSDYIKLLQISRLHIYMTYPFVLSWSMLEAMACGAPILGSATPPVKEVIKQGETGFLFDFFDSEGLVENAIRMMNRDNSDLISNARDLLDSSYSFTKNSYPKYIELINKVMWQSSIK